MPIPEGTPIGTVVIGEHLSSSYGDLYAARQPGLERRAAVRVLRREQLRDDSLVERFHREARLGARVVHPNVVQVYDYFTWHEDRFVVMEYVDGPTLAQLLERRARVPRPLAIRIGLEIVRGLEELHASGVLLGLLRPGKVHLHSTGAIKLRGLDTALEPGDDPPTELSALPPFAAPELGLGRPASAKSDVYSLGALLHALGTGRPPSRRGASRSRLGLRVGRLVRRCLARRPDGRPSLAQVKRALERASSDPTSARCRLEIASWLWDAGGEPAHPEGTPSVREPRRADPGDGRSPGLIPVLAAASVAILLLGGWALVRALEPGVQATPPVAAALVPSPAATVVFRVWPWAEVSIDDTRTFLTPRAQPIELEPGGHEVVFRHPTLGEVRRRIVLSAGESRIVHQSFGLGAGR